MSDRDSPRMRSRVVPPEKAYTPSRVTEAKRVPAGKFASVLVLLARPLAPRPSDCRGQAAPRWHGNVFRPRKQSGRSLAPRPLESKVKRVLGSRLGRSRTVAWQKGRGSSRFLGSVRARRCVRSSSTAGEVCACGRAELASGRCPRALQTSDAVFVRSSGGLQPRSERGGIVRAQLPR
jgi:hypothetical protein